jgi:hypothetical protein
MCEWIEDRSAWGSRGVCVANLPRLSARSALETAAWQLGWYQLCPRLAQIVVAFDDVQELDVAERSLQTRSGSNGWDDAQLIGSNGRSRSEGRGAALEAGRGSGPQELLCPGQAAIQRAAPQLRAQADSWNGMLKASQAGVCRCTCPSPCALCPSCPGPARTMIL